jgi:hypothetical protein
MAYVAPTPAELKSRYPAFANVDDAVVQSALDEAARQVDESWTEGDFATAQMLYACHVMTMNGVLSGAGGIQLASFRSIRSGALTLERGTVNGDDGSWLSGSEYGRRFLTLRRQNKGGMRVTGAGVSCPSPYSKDWPPFYWMA